MLATDGVNQDASALLAESTPTGEMRRASLLYVDLVGSTELSERHEPELYRSVIRRYKAVCRAVIEDRYGGFISHIAGDGLMAVFGLPTPHEDDAERAVRSALDITSELEALSAEVERAVGERLAARSGVHKGIVYLDLEDNDVYGLAANVTARLHGLADPGTVVISAEMRAIVGDTFAVVEEPARQVKGVSQPLRPMRVIGVRTQAKQPRRSTAGPFVGRAAELGTLRAAWERVEQGSGPLGVHITGEPGIGKSRLCTAFLLGLDAEASTCVELAGSPLHADAVLRPVRGLVESRTAVDARGEGRLASLARDVASVGLAPDEAVPRLAAIIGVPLDGQFEPVPAEGRKLHEAIVEGAAVYLLACAGPGPAVIVAEDVHWYDESTLDVLGRVLRGSVPTCLC